uniref:Integrase catalytic domain-containing protein n=1 Tax=Cannabis sativa TaxID=3483 RepID=A0A803PDR9_CANSA
MGLDESSIIRKSTVLISFSGEQKYTIGEIILPVYAEGVNEQTRFLVIDSPSAYNVILGQPWIHAMHVVPCTYHQVISQLEKLALTLITATRKLQPYFQCHQIIVVSGYLLRSILHKPELSERLTKWAIELSEYDIVYQPITLIKSQVLANFIADFISTAKDQADKELLCLNAESKLKWTLSIDGSSNFRGSGLGIVLTSPEGDVIQQAVHFEFKATNNETEYEALIAELSLQKIPRLENSQADALANLGSAMQTKSTIAIPIIHLQWPAVWRETSHYWPTRRADSINHVRRCDKCQQFTQVSHLPPERLNPIVSPWPFMKCRVDIVGKLPTAPRQRINDFKDFCKRWGIQLSFSTPRYPQANVQVESTNKTIIGTLKKRLEKAKGRWADELLGVLWSYRTTARTSTGEKPFSLTYGAEVVILAEQDLPTARLIHATDDHNDSQLCHNLDLIDEHKDQAPIRVATYQLKIAKHFNKSIRTMNFKERDWVLHRIVQNTQEPSTDKLGPTWEGPYQITMVVGRGAYKL